LVKPHADYYVDYLNARWLRPVSLRMNQAKGPVTVCVCNAPIQSLKVGLQILAVCTTRCVGLAALSYNKNKNIFAFKQFCSFVSVSIT